jgi:hypothetical protein
MGRPTPTLFHEGLDEKSHSGDGEQDEASPFEVDLRDAMVKPNARQRPGQNHRNHQREHDPEWLPEISRMLNSISDQGENLQREYKGLDDSAIPRLRQVAKAGPYHDRQSGERREAADGTPKGTDDQSTWRSAEAISLSIRYQRSLRCLRCGDRWSGSWSVRRLILRLLHRGLLNRSLLRCTTTGEPGASPAVPKPTVRAG